MSPQGPRRRRWLRRALYWLPLVVLAPAGGLLFLPSHPAAYAKTQAAGPSPGPTSPAPASSRGAPAHGAPAETNPAAPKGVGGVSGRVLYEQACATCHGADGGGTDRSDYVSLHGIGEAAVDFQLTTGRMPRKDTSLRLPPYKAVLPEADIAALDYYISTYISKGGPPIPAVDPAAGDQGKGGEMFREACAACHSWAGAGGVLYNHYVPRITSANAKQVAEAIRVGPDQMPVFGPHQFTQQQLNDIVAYVTKDLEHPYDKGGNPLDHIGPIAEGFVIMAIALPAILLFVRWIGQRG